jgi:hypothetical protein
MVMRRTTTLFKNMEDLAETMAKREELYVAFVLSGSGDTYQVYRHGETTADAFDAMNLKGYALATDDIVLIYDLGRQPIIIGKVMTAANKASSERLDYPLYLYADGPNFRLNKANGDAFFHVDTGYLGGVVHMRNAADLMLARDNSGSIPVFRVDGQNGSLCGGGSAPTIAVTAAAGTGASASINFGNDTFMYIIINGGTGATIGAVATVTFNTAKPDSNYIVNINPYNANAADNGKVYAGAVSATQFNITLRFAMSGTTYHYIAIVGGMGA